MKKKKKSFTDREIYIAGLGTLAVLTALLFLCRVLLKDIVQIPPCPVYQYLGLYCPACFGTRAFLHLLRGELLESFLAHPAVLYSAVTAGWFFLTQTIAAVTGREYGWTMHFRPIYVYIGLGLSLLNCVIKNLP